MFKFEKLEVWSKAVDLYGEVSSASQSIHQKDQFSLGEQIRRAALSVSTNIAEGTGREGNRESKNFFNIAKGSVYEVLSLLWVMRKQGYLAEEKYAGLYVQCDEIARMLSGMLSR
jgi:four helix bundle protein